MQQPIQGRRLGKCSTGDSRLMQPDPRPHSEAVGVACSTLLRRYTAPSSIELRSNQPAPGIHETRTSGQLRTYGSWLYTATEAPTSERERGTKQFGSFSSNKGLQPLLSELGKVCIVSIIAKPNTLTHEAPLRFSQLPKLRPQDSATIIRPQ